MLDAKSKKVKEISENMLNLSPHTKNSHIMTGARMREYVIFLVSVKLAKLQMPSTKKIIFAPKKRQ